MTVKDCIMGRRSIRVFEDKPISDDILKEIVTEASYAPSWKHTQITRYVAVTGELKEKIAAECCNDYAKNGEIIRNAAVLMVVTFIKNRSGFERDGSFTNHREDRWQFFDTGIASQTLSLAAHEHGIGSVILGIFDDKKVASILELPEDREAVVLIPMGYPAESPVAPKRKPIEELLDIR